MKPDFNCSSPIKKVTLVKKNTKIGILVVTCFLAVLLFSLNYVVANSTYEVDCSSCHSNAGTLSVSTSSSVTIGTGENFQLDVDVTGGGSLTYVYTKFPHDVSDNDEFAFAPSGVQDGGAGDDNPSAGAISATFTVTAPDFPGDYELAVYAVGSGQNYDRQDITVTVEASGEGPVFTGIGRSAQYPLASQALTVNATVESTVGIDKVILSYSLDNGSTWTNRTMTLTAGVYEANIPGQPYGTTVIYKVIARDTDGIETPSSQFTYVSGYVPVEPIEIPQLHYGWLLGAPALVIAYIGTALEYYDEERFTKVHGIMLGTAYILTSINVLFLFFEGPGIWITMDPANLFNLASMVTFVHCWHIWLGIISMILGTLAVITHLGGWKTCNLGLPAVIIWTILGFTGFYLGTVFRM